MNWGTRIILAYVGFIGIIASIVTISMLQEVHLVSQDYYREEIKYQKQIERIQNNQSLNDNGLRLEFVAQCSELKLLPPKDTDVTVKLHFFRPSDASMDKIYELELKSTQRKNLALNHFQKGLWKIKVNWNDKSKDFYMEKIIVI